MDDELTGREALIEALWTTLRSRSALLVGPRRVGKSRLLDHLESNPRTDTRLVRIDLEGVDSVAAAVGRILERIEESSAIKSLMSRVHAVQAAGVAVHWAAEDDEADPWHRLASTLLKLNTHEDLVVVALDEVPWWLDRLEAATPGGARSALAQLRYLADDRRLAHVRWVLTGSVGLAGRAAEWSASAEINHLEPMIVAPLDPASGRTLFEVEATGLGCRVDAAAATEAHRVAGGLPYWIKVLAGGCCATVGRDGRVTVESVQAECERRLGTHFRHGFQEEMDTHFTRRWSAEEIRLRTLVFDELAPAAAPVSRRGAITAVLGKVGDGGSKRDIEDIVLRLIDEFYLVEVGDRIGFAVPLYAAWWARWGG